MRVCDATYDDDVRQRCGHLFVCIYRFICFVWVVVQPQRGARAIDKLGSCSRRRSILLCLLCTPNLPQYTGGCVCVCVREKNIRRHIFTKERDFFLVSCRRHQLAFLCALMPRIPFPHTNTHRISAVDGERPANLNGHRRGIKVLFDFYFRCWRRPAYSLYICNAETSKKDVFIILSISLYIIRFCVYFLCENNKKYNISK